MKLVLCGVSYHNCPVEIREQVSFTQEQRRFMLRKMYTEAAVSEAAILETCNRVEFYLYTRKDFDVDTFLGLLIGQVRPDAVGLWRSYSKKCCDVDTVRHLFDVAAGLNSQTIGENQVLSQVKGAYSMALDCGTSKFLFHRLFHNALRVGKKVRTETEINCGAVSISLAAVELARRQVDLSVSTAIVIGAGDNAQLAARYLLKAGLRELVVANRSPERARAVVSRLGAGCGIGLDEIGGYLPKADLLISSTAAPKPILSCEAAEGSLSQRDKPLLVVDIAVPRDVDPRIARFDGVCLYNIDDLDKRICLNREKRDREIPRARRIVDDFTQEFVRRQQLLDVVPVISQLMQKGLELADNEAKRYSKDFRPADADKLRVFAESLVKKVLDGPIRYVKSDSEDQLSSEQLLAAHLINQMFFSHDRHSGG